MLPGSPCRRPCSGGPSDTSQVMLTRTSKSQRLQAITASASYCGQTNVDTAAPRQQVVTLPRLTGETDCHNTSNTFRTGLPHKLMYPASKLPANRPQYSCKLPTTASTPFAVQGQVLKSNHEEAVYLSVEGLTARAVIKTLMTTWHGLCRACMLAACKHCISTAANTGMYLLASLAAVQLLPTLECNSHLS